MLAAGISIFAPFIFPWQFTLLLSVPCSIFFLPATLVSGFLLDVLYKTSHAVPYFTLLGALLMVISYFVQQFVKTRIMS